MDTHPQHKTHQSTSHDPGHTLACSTASATIKPGDPVYKEMTFDGTQTAIATIGGRIKFRGQDFLMTAAGPFTDRLPIEKNDREKKASPEWLLVAGSLYYASHSNGRPELNYALIRPRPDVHIEDDVELFPSPINGLLQLPRFTSEEDFKKINRQIPVRSVTASAGAVVGELEPIPYFLPIPGSSALQEVYEVEFNVPLALGDSGSWVFNASNNRLLGHIVAGIPEAGIALIVPAYKVFAELALRPH